MAVLSGPLGRAQTPVQPPPPAEPPTFHVGVDAVRIDAVVTDSNGQLVTNLTADDFELKDDGRPQKVTLATFVPVASGPEMATRVPTPPQNASLGNRASTAPVMRPLARDEVQRSIVILVDDLGLSWESLLPTRKALHSLLDDSLQPTDLVALTRTGAYAGMQRQFTTDRRLLHSAVDELRWTALSRRGVEPFECMPGTGMTNTGPSGTPGGGTSDPAGDAEMSDVREKISARVFALSSVALGGRDIPGDAIDDAARIDGDSAPAVRQFNPGDDLIYSCNIYNGDDAVERSATIWRDGKQVLTAPADSLEVAAGRVIGALRLTAEVAPGDYVLQIDARTATGRKPPSTATTRVDFHVK